MSENHSTFEQIQRDRAVRIGDISLERSSYKYFQADPNRATTYGRQVLNHNQDHTILNQLFFSPQNVQAIQLMIRKSVYDRSGGEFIIGDQDETELIIVMRSVFLQRSKNRSDNIREQIMELNQIIVNECVPKVISEIATYNGYLKDASQLYGENPLPHPVNVSSAGTKTFSFTNYF